MQYQFGLSNATNMFNNRKISRQLSLIMNRKSDRKMRIMCSKSKIKTNSVRDKKLLLVNFHAINDNVKPAGN